jgi:hypothetical protein
MLYTILQIFCHYILADFPGLPYNLNTGTPTAGVMLNQKIGRTAILFLTCF